MKRLMPMMGLIVFSSCCPHIKHDFEDWSKECQQYRERNSQKKLIPYADDVIHGKD